MNQKSTKLILQCIVLLCIAAVFVSCNRGVGCPNAF